LKIYIYGNQSFKKEIHNTLEHANIKFKLDNNTAIEEIDNIAKLKETIENNPRDIYLIDDDKIIKKNSLNNKLKFLAPKDGIEEEYLIESGIADLSIDSLKELPKYIIKRYEELKLLEPKEKILEEKIEEEPSSIELDDELAMLLSKSDDKKNKKIKDFASVNNLEDIFDLENDINLDEIEDFIGDVNNQSNDKRAEEVDILENFNDNFGLNNISFDYDDDDILTNENDSSNLENNLKTNSANILDELNFLGEEIKVDEDFSDLDTINDDLFGDLDFLNEDKEEKIDIEKKDEELFQEFNFPTIQENKEQKEYKSLQGEKMDDEFFELDSLNEKDLLEALDCKIDENSSRNIQKQVVSEIKKETISVDSSNVNDLSLLLSKLLSNKTLEITIKIKD
jgi:hypothetical protein